MNKFLLQKKIIFASILFCILFIGFFPILEAEETATAAVREDDITTVSGGGIDFQLFNYSLDINKTADGSAWRDFSKYFTFRDSSLTTGNTPSENIYVPNPSINAEHDVDGFSARHATVERVLDASGNPVLDLTRNADGTTRTDPGESESVRSMAHLFSNAGDRAADVYHPENTVLQKDGIHYWFDSADNAVDYDTENNLFRVRNYVERNSTTAGYGSSYGDFLPFTYTNGEVLGTASNGTEYHVESSDVDYWFGMTMEVSFFQTKNGKIDDQNMQFNFSGDDDVWVFIDDVLVLDLGGTHGTVNGSINFATGEVLQYLTWSGANSSEKEKTDGSSTSFPTTIRECFDAAGKTPDGGWNENGQVFANYTEHTLKFFYLERGAAVANCKIDFMLPTLPDKSLIVTKDFSSVGSSEVADFLEDTLSYQFRVVKADENGNPTNELFIQSGMEYNLLENGVKIGTGTVGSDGTFSIKAGQSVQFTDMLLKGDGAAEYIVEEIMPDGLVGQYGGVEYEVSGAGGETREEEGPTAEFTAFATGVLTAEQTQTVIFRNKVDVSALSILKISKEVEKGSRFTGEEIFQMQVKLGGSLLPAGSKYQVAEEIREVTLDGSIQLKIGETAMLLNGILSGTEYEVTELGTEKNGYRVTYTGTVSPAGTVNCTERGANGSFPLHSVVHVTVTNADFDFSVNIPIRKEAFGNNGTSIFTFIVEEVEKSDDGMWIKKEELPGTDLEVQNNMITDGTIVVGYPAGTQGTFYYRISERRTSEDYIYDDTFFIVEVSVSDNQGEIVSILKDGEESVPAGEPLAFLNRSTTDEPVYELPETGGAGMYLYTVGGIVMMSSAFLFSKSLQIKSQG